MADLIEQVQAVNELTTSINTLKVGAMIFIVVMSIIALAAAAIWLRIRRTSADADIKKAELESDGKRDRARAYNDTITHLSTTIVGHEKRMQDIIGGIKEALDARTAQTRGLLAEQSRMMQYLVDAQRGFMNTEDSLRVTENVFDQNILTECNRIAAMSIERNHYSERQHLIRTRVIQALGKVVTQSLRSLLDYNMSIDVRCFFSHVNGKYAYTDTSPQDFVLVGAIWEVIKAAHESRLTDPSLDTASVLELLALDVERVCKDAFANGKVIALDFYAAGDEEGTGSGLRRMRSDPEIGAAQ